MIVFSIVCTTALLPLPPLLPLRRRLLLALLLYYYWIRLRSIHLRHPLLDVHLHILGSIVYCSNSCSSAATDFMLSSIFASVFVFTSDFILFLRSYLLRSSAMFTFYVELVMASQELRPWIGASCHECIVIAIWIPI